MTNRQRQFAAAYGRTRDPARAALEAGCRAKDPARAGRRLLQLPAVAEALARQEALAQQEARRDPAQRVLEELSRIAFDETGADALKPQERLRAMELLMKHLGMFERPKVERENVLQVQLEDQLALWAE